MNPIDTTESPTARLATVAPIRVGGALAVQNGTPMLTGFVMRPLVTATTAVDIFDPAQDTGYQRTPVAARIKKAAEYYRQGGRMPNPLLLNLREEDFAGVRVVITDGDRSSYDAAIASGGNWIGGGYIEFDGENRLWIYDGQHRAGGLDLLADSAEFDEFPVPVTITLGLDTTDEMKEFYEVNTNAVSVKTDLAFTLLYRMAETDPDLQQYLADTDKDWITRGQAVLKVLQDLDGPWKGRFQAANQRKKKGDGIIIPMPQFINSLKPVLDMPLLKRADAETVASILNAYWRGIQIVLPEPFEGDPNEYVIQKGQGTVSLHRVLPQVVEVVRAMGGRLGDPQPYADAMKRLPDLNGEAVDADGNLITKSGAEYWLVGSVASGFSGDAGRRRLARLIQAHLPAPSETIAL